MLKCSTSTIAALVLHKDLVNSSGAITIAAMALEKDTLSQRAPLFLGVRVAKGTHYRSVPPFLLSFRFFSPIAF